MILVSRFARITSSFFVLSNGLYRLAWEPLIRIIAFERHWNVTLRIIGSLHNRTYLVHRELHESHASHRSDQLCMMDKNVNISYCLTAFQRCDGCVDGPRRAVLEVAISRKEYAIDTGDKEPFIHAAVQLAAIYQQVRNLKKICYC